MHHGWREHAYLGFFDKAIGGDDQAIPYLAESCRRSVEADCARIGWSGQEIRFEPSPSIEVIDLNLLIRDQIGCFE